MNNFFEKIKQKFNVASILEQIIYINIIVFALGYLVKAFSFLMHWNEDLFFNWFSLSADLNSFLSKPWTLVSYGFLHGNFLHILFNLLVLYYIGNLFLDFFSKKDFIIYYFAGIIFGGIVYLFSYNYFPTLKANTTYLVGASAGVTSVLVGLASKIPNYAIRFRFIGAVKLWYLAVAFILLDIIQLPVSNTGGHLAHLGGALVGFLLTNQINKGKNISNLFSNLFKSKKKAPLRTVYKNSKGSATVKNSNTNQRKIDEILDKISKSGYETLTKEEKDFLFSVGKK
jgi:membrane associated rhomboid family serine protease